MEWLVEGDTFLCILRVLCGEFAVVLVFSFVLPLCPPQSFFRRNAAENEGLFELPL